MTTVLLAHSHPAMRAGLRSGLARAQHVEIVAEASRGEETLRLILQLWPDVALVACSLSSRLDGVEVAERVRVAARRVRVLALGAPGDDESTCRMWQAGAAGCISERAELKSIAKVVEAAARGERLWTAEQVARVQRWWGEVGSRLDALTERERQVLEIMAEALGDCEVAERLCLSKHTVHSHVKSVLGKLQVRTRQEAIVFYLKRVEAGSRHRITNLSDDKEHLSMIR